MVNMANLLNRFAVAGLALFTVVLGAAVSPAPAAAGASAWVENEFTRVRLISALDGSGQGESASLGLQFELKKNWKVYWRSPGDAGYPPSIDWKGS